MDEIDGKEFSVAGDGNIVFPLLGIVHVAGRSDRELEADLVKRLAKYVNEPRVSVDVAGVSSPSQPPLRSLPSASEVVRPATSASVAAPSKVAAPSEYVASVSARRVPEGPPPGPVTLPMEVFGDGTVVTRSFTVPEGADLGRRPRLWIKIHGLHYETEASVKLNDSGWIPINSGTVMIHGLAKNFGGIGGAFHTLALTLNLPPGGVTAGTNTISFRFDGTDGVVSGYRVLAFNVQSGGNDLVPASSFVDDDPSTWKPPSTAPSDIAEGRSLWHTAALVVPSSSGAADKIRAHCDDCHSEDGRDLKYFNYSNLSIQNRSQFHGLTAQQGLQIASYIRTLDTPAPGRPWNPPYQPGPGLDSQPVANWSAGAGLSAVLPSDAAVQDYLAPGGSTAAWAANSYLNARELPIPLELPDWNAWLPQIAPVDGFGTGFNALPIYRDYLALRARLRPNDEAAYANADSYFQNWMGSHQQFMSAVKDPAHWHVNKLAARVYSVAQWTMVKQWEINQEFGLEGMPSAIFGAKANPRGWDTIQPFRTSPHQMGMTFGPGILNGTEAASEALGYGWYHLQLILNDGQGRQTDLNPIDYAYAQGAPRNLSVNTGRTPTAMLELIWMIKSLQGNTTKAGPSGGYIHGFEPVLALPSILVNLGWEGNWSATPPATRLTLTTDYVKPWFAKISTFPRAEFYAGKDGAGRPWATPNEDPATDNYMATFGGGLWYMLPRLRYVGVDPNLLNQISAWAATIFPAGNWAVNNSVTCLTNDNCPNAQ